VPVPADANRNRIATAIKTPVIEINWSFVVIMILLDGERGCCRCHPSIVPEVPAGANTILDSDPTIRQDFITLRPAGKPNEGYVATWLDYFSPLDFNIFKSSPP
jgi:hypothetical protein